MIKWNLFSKEKPPIDKKDKWNKENETTPLLLVCIISKHTQTKHILFGQYYHKSNHWTFDGFHGEATVIGWSELNYAEQDTWANASKP